MAAPITIGGGITFGGGIKTGNHNIYQGVTTQNIQNVAGSDGDTGLFFQGGSWPTTPKPSYYDIAAGWLVDQIPGATVVSTDPGAQTITITGGVFVSGTGYSFTGI
jgi:hypothetical protein